MYLEGKLFQANSQTGSGLVSRSCLSDDGEFGSRTVGVSGSDLDAGNV